MQNVIAWAEDVVIPTYPVGAPEKNPMFLEKRIYQGSSGVVYPHPVIEKISDEKKDVTYRAVYLENEYLKIMILPELGGRIQMAFDKVKQRHFIYYNQVIKPALVGLTGPWISGGIEFNWPQHHRPSTFEPVDFTITENEDGSKTVWVNEIERMFRTKGMAGFTLYPGKAYLEIKGRLYNRTAFPQTFLWWANPAVKVNDFYQSVFPPDVYAVFDHGKRDVSSFPIADGIYYKVDYAPGTDISRYKNIPVPTSYMAITSRYNFMGGYEHDTEAGLLHVADHHISPGKKQWTWGNGEFGKAWDKNLTDEDGPYIELMTGVFTDNQPDFSWIQPQEEKTFTQYFMPYQKAGVVKNATKEAAVNMEIEGDTIQLKLYVTSEYNNLRVAVLKDEKVLFSEDIQSSPANPYCKTVVLKEAVSGEGLKVVVTDLTTSKVLVSYQKEEAIKKEIPAAAQAAKQPEAVESIEQLFLTGLHLEQYRHATYKATDYYNEALKRDPDDCRCNNALGLWLLKRGKFQKAEMHFKKAIATLTKRNPNPYDGEAFYNLGWALKMQDKNDDAFDAFYKSTWNDAWQHAGFLNLARIATLRRNYEEALELIDKSLVRNYNSHSARHLKTAILRKLGKTAAAKQLIEDSLAIDPFNFGCLFEEYLLLKTEDASAATAVSEHLLNISRNWVHNFIETALDYAHAGLYEEAAAILSFYEASAGSKYTLVPYYKGWFAYQAGNLEKAIACFKEGALLAPEYIFPNRVEEIIVLNKATELNPTDAKGWYYFGNLLYNKQQYAEAIECWEKSAQLDNQFPTVYRNLSLAYYNKLNDGEKALRCLERAFHLDDTDARVLMELDQLYKKLCRSYKQRLEYLLKYDGLVSQRDDLYLEKVTLYNHAGDYETAKRLLGERQFHPWEGGEGKVIQQYLLCCVALAINAIEKSLPGQAIDFLTAAENYPSNLGEGKLTGTQENDIFYWKAVALEMLERNDEAIGYFKKATTGVSEPVQAIFYNDAQPDKIFYQGLAWRKLGNTNAANKIFDRLISFGSEHLNDTISIDYFAVSLPDMLVFDANLDEKNKIHCLYLMALGNMGYGNNHNEIAKNLFEEILQMDNNHQGAFMHQQLLLQQSIAVN